MNKYVNFCGDLSEKKDAHLKKAETLSIIIIRNRILQLISETAKTLNLKINRHRAGDILYSLDLWKNNLKKKNSLLRKQFFERWQINLHDQIIINNLLDSNIFVTNILPVI
ncbi:MAG: hypothetical protein A3J63_02260 [Candidatus Moranbacteria bacterium RIFCSPHIGHO2_02_FULL_40_12b]|nr:MAG: hypothetical protein A3J63_02260 [Candidatus Moranbacteria bacterium RIFCSPHIGHO2_02_FULL_40_12b]